VNKAVAWIVWVLVAGAGAIAGFVFWAFALQGPDHAAAPEKVRLFTFIVVGGMGIPLLASLYFMIKSRFAWGTALAFLMIPSMVGFLFLFEK
jgi:predicted membrane channel-forming protein YqfA (hemolysin III family)